MHPRAAELVRALGLAPHPEGGFFREVFRSTSSVTPATAADTRDALTTIYFLLAEGQFSRWHGLASDEIWHHYEGDAVELVVATPAMDRIERSTLGALAAGAEPLRVVPALHWQTARALGSYALCGCTVGPGFEFRDFRFLFDDAPATAALASRAPDLLRYR